MSRPSTLLEIFMKKTFLLTSERIKPERQVDAVKSEIRKYIKRERKRELPQDTDFWDFDCRFGPDDIRNDEIHVSAINKAIDEAVSDQLKSFYLEIFAKPVARIKKPTDDE